VGTLGQRRPGPDRQLHLTLQVLGQMPAGGQTRHLIEQLATDPVITATRSQRSRAVDRDPDPYSGLEIGPERSHGIDLGP
jgi:hypothetical protein